MTNEDEVGQDERETEEAEETEETFDVGTAHLEGWRVFTDGGVWRKAASPIGGAYAWVMVDPLNREIGFERRAIRPRDVDRETIEINTIELVAQIRGLTAFLDYRDMGRQSIESVTLCSDSLVGLSWLRGTYQRSMVPAPVTAELRVLEQRIAESGLAVKTVLLAGHPSVKPTRTKPVTDIERGYIVRIHKGNKKVAYPVSLWNVRCNDDCDQVKNTTFGK